MKQQVFAAVFAAVTMLGQARPSAQPATPPAPAAPAQAQPAIPPVYQVQTDANTTREQVQDILRQYPPTVGEVLRGTRRSISADTNITSAASRCRPSSKRSACCSAANTFERRDVQVPVAGQVWWRAAGRARLEVSHAATRPMTWLHGITAALVVGVVLAVAGWAWPSIATGFDAAKTVGATLLTSDAAMAIAGPLRTTLLIALAAGAVLVITPIAIYLALSDE